MAGRTTRQARWRRAGAGCLYVAVAYFLAYAGRQTAAAADLRRSITAQASSPSARKPVADTDSQYLDRYCVRCHNERQRVRGLALDHLDLRNVAAEADVWEKVLRRLHAGAMPPAGTPRPDQRTTDDFMSAVEARIDEAAAVSPNPGRTSVHRMNRAEYTNAI